MKCLCASPPRKTNEISISGTRIYGECRTLGSVRKWRSLAIIYLFLFSSKCKSRLPNGIFRNDADKVKILDNKQQYSSTISKTKMISIALMRISEIIEHHIRYAIGHYYIMVTSMHGLWSCGFRFRDKITKTTVLRQHLSIAFKTYTYHLEKIK